MVRLFPYVITGLYLAAGLVYGLAGDWRKCAYSLLAAAINAVVLF